MTRTSDSVPLNGISRRTFCKGAAVLGIWGGLASFGLAGCAPHTRAEELADSAPWKAGTYTTEVTGHNAPYTMTVTFSDDAITAIDTSANQESLGVGADALKALQQQAIDNQTINLDAVTGATLSSLSLQTGLEDCAKQAQAFEVLSEAPAPEKPAVEEVYDADVCVVGGGGSGLAAAIAAVQAGASVIALEKCGITGGSTNVSEGALNAVDPERQEPQGIEDSIPTFYETTMKGGHNTNNPSSCTSSRTTRWIPSTGSRAWASSSRTRSARPPDRSASAAIIRPRRRATPTSARSSSSSTTTPMPSCCSTTCRQKSSFWMTPVPWWA